MVLAVSGATRRARMGRGEPIVIWRAGIARSQHKGIDMDNDQGERVIQRVRHPLVIRRAKVARVSSLSPHMRRIVVSGAEINGFFSPGFDDHVKLFMPAPGAALVLPSVGERGMERWGRRR